MLVRFGGLGVALAASGVLIGAPGGGVTASSAPVPVAMAWAHAQRAVTLATLPDGSAYQPAMFFDARTSVGTAVTPDGKSLRLLIVGAGRPVRQLRSVPFGSGPSFQSFATAGDVLIWAEGSRGAIQMWRAGLRDREPPRLLTADGGGAATYGSDHDMVVDKGTLNWTVARGDVTEVRSIPVTGGPVRTRTVPGRWKMSAWPWLIDGITATAGTTRLRNIETNQEVRVAATGSRSVTQCSPAWCRVVKLTRDGTRIDLMRPDGGGRRFVAGDTAQTVITDVVPLDGYEMYAKLGPNSALTGNVQLLAYELATRRTVEISPDANRVSYRNGVLSWTTGSLNTFVWHALDLRTI